MYSSSLLLGEITSKSVYMPYNCDQSFSEGTDLTFTHQGVALTFVDTTEPFDGLVTVFSSSQENFSR